jgi:hypothetical protein
MADARRRGRNGATAGVSQRVTATDVSPIASPAIADESV